MGDGFLWEASALIPSIGVGLLFWFVMRAIMRADRGERRAEREAEEAYLARQAEEKSDDQDCLSTAD